jgi:hypothetical protein
MTAILKKLYFLICKIIIILDKRIFKISIYKKFRNVQEAYKKIFKREVRNKDDKK